MTNKRSILRSDIAESPGATLAEELDARGMTQKELAAQCGRPVQVINEIIKEKRPSRRRRRWTWNEYSAYLLNFG